MADVDVRQTLLEASRVMLRPLVKLLMEEGVHYSALVEELAMVFVEVSLRQQQGEEEVSTASVAAMAGLPEDEARRLLMNAAADSNSGAQVLRPELVLSAWHVDERYTGPYGVPLELPFRPEVGDKNGDFSFVNLVEEYGEGADPEQMLTLLKSNGAVSEQHGFLRVLRRDYPAAALSPELVKRLGDIGQMVLSTATANVQKNASRPEYFDRLVYAEHGCPQSTIEAFDEYVKERGQALIEELDAWIATQEKRNPDVPKNERQETGVYMVHYVDTWSDEEPLKSLIGRLDLNK